MITSKTAFPVHEWPGLTFEEGEPGKFHVVADYPLRLPFWKAYRELLRTLTIRAGKPTEELFPEALEFVTIGEVFRIKGYKDGTQGFSAAMQLGELLGGKDIPDIGVSLTQALLIGYKVEICHFLFPWRGNM